MTCLRKALTRTGVAAAIGIAVAGTAPAFAQGDSVNPPSAGAPPTADPALSKALSEQEKIYQSRGEIVPAEYVIDRSLLSYTISLLPEFDRSLADLGPKDRWLDIGAGEGQAILDYYGARYDAMHREGQERRGSKAQAVAISIEDRRTAEWHQTAATLEPDKIRYLFGKPLSDYSLNDLGRFNLATDVYGGFSYTPNLSRFMEKVLASLQVQSSFYTLLIDVHPEHWTKAPARPRTSFQTEIVDAKGAEIKVCSWLRRITCVQVTCEQEPKWDTPIERYRIQKVCNDVIVPALTSVHFAPGTPPARRFQLRQPVPAKPVVGRDRVPR